MIERKLQVIWIMIVLAGLSIGQVRGQNQLRTSKLQGKEISILERETAGRFIHGASKIYLIGKSEIPRMIKFDEKSVSAEEFNSKIETNLRLGASSKMVLLRNERDHLGIGHYKFQQQYNNLEVEGLQYIVHEQNGFVKSANGRAAQVDSDLNTKPSITEQDAFQKVIQITGALAGGQNTTPGQLKITSRDFTYLSGSYHLVYQFDVFVSTLEQWRVSIDAHTKEVVNKVSKVMSCFEDSHTKNYLPYTDGTGLTDYYGSKNIKTELFNGSYRLRGQTVNGGLIETYDLASQTNLQLAVDFTDADNDFTDVNAKAGVSAHWGAEQAYEYYKTKFNRNGIDDNGMIIKSYTHVGANLGFAMWTGSVMLYGDNSGNPFVELSTVGHELTHGVTQHESGLLTSYESGALNESFSDIMGKVIEFNSLGVTTWIIGDLESPPGIRNLSNPSQFYDPDTYYGNNWVASAMDAGGVHTNCGVQNFWFYLLSNGGSGINDNGLSYSVMPIGVDQAAAITYRSLSQYITSTSEYIDARFGSIQAAGDLYGAGSAQQLAVIAAWDAVGVYDEPYIKELQATNELGFTATLKVKAKSSKSSTSVHFDYGLTPSYGSTTSPVNIGSGNSYVNVSAPITGLVPQSLYYYRAIATNSNGAVELSGQFSTVSSTPILIVKHASPVNSTSATLRATINPNSSPATYYVKYGIAPALNNTTSVENLSASISDNNVLIPLTGLIPQQEYSYQFVVSNSFGQVSSNAKSFYTYDPIVISNVSPVMAFPGAVVTITGANFNSQASQNVVFFGPVKAQVTFASATMLTVIVPQGASYGPLSVTNLPPSLSATSSQKFTPLFYGSATSPVVQYKGSLSYIYGSNSPFSMFTEDINDDGKVDVIAGSGGGFNIFPNNYSPGPLTTQSFGTPLQFITYAGLEHIADLNGDGKKDLISKADNGLILHRNISSQQGISFNDVNFQFPAGYYPVDVSSGDFDSDGKIDLAVVIVESATYGKNVVIFHNENENGQLDAANFVAADTLSNEWSTVFSANLFVEDINNDKKDDVVWVWSNGFYEARNTTSNGLINFSVGSTSGQNISISTCSLLDLNQDGAKDLVTGSSSGTISIYTSSGGGFYNTPAAVINTGLQWYLGDIKCTDIDGDGRIDFIVGGPAGKFLIYRNSLNPGDPLTSAGFSSLGTYDGGNNGYYVANAAIGDFNLDGKPDLVCSNQNPSCDLWENIISICPIPQSLTVTNITADGALLSWSDPVSIGNYNVSYRIAGSGTWSTVNVSAQTFYQWTNLMVSTNYEAKVSRSCGSTYSSYSNSVFFKTDYCTSKGQNSSNDFIDLVQLGALNNPSGNDGGYKSYVTLASPEINQTGSYALNFSASVPVQGPIPGKRARNWKAWIDFNQNGSFEDSELIMSTSSIVTGTLSAFFTVPSTATLGFTRMRVSMKYGGVPSSCEIFPTGEVEDYLVNIADPNGHVVARIGANPEEQSITTEEKSEVTLYPNPVKDILKLTGIATQNQVSITDMVGHEVYSGLAQDEIDVRNLPAGIYLLVVVGDSKRILKFVKE